MAVCEVRIPTYKRPDLLQRSLSTLIAQTYENWKAIVLDDSPEQEAKVIVQACNDDRIIYRPHKVNLGRARNIDYAFLSTSYIGGDYAFVLEDDNYLFPDFIAENIASAETKGVNIVLRNQELRLDKNGISNTTNITTRGKWFNQGIYNPIELHARLFFCEGISNGGLFWNTKIRSNLQVGSKVKDSWHQELFRTLQIEEKVYFEPKPLCVFTVFNTVYIEPSKETSKSNNIYKILRGVPEYNRSPQSILMYLIQKYGNSIVQEAKKIADDKGAEILLEHKLIEAFYFDYKFKQISSLETMILLIKSSLRYFKDPYKHNLLSKQ